MKRVLHQHSPFVGPLGGVIWGTHFAAIRIELRERGGANLKLISSDPPRPLANH